MSVIFLSLRTGSIITFGFGPGSTDHSSEHSSFSTTSSLASSSGWSLCLCMFRGGYEDGDYQRQGRPDGRYFLLSPHVLSHPSHTAFFISSPLWTRPSLSPDVTVGLVEHWPWSSARKVSKSMLPVWPNAQRMSSRKKWVINWSIWNARDQLNTNL